MPSSIELQQQQQGNKGKTIPVLHHAVRFTGDRPISWPNLNYERNVIWSTVFEIKWRYDPRTNCPASARIISLFDFKLKLIHKTKLSTRTVEKCYYNEIFTYLSFALNQQLTFLGTLLPNFNFVGCRNFWPPCSYDLATNELRMKTWWRYFLKSNPTHV